MIFGDESKRRGKSKSPSITPDNLSHDPFKACVVPWPIGWISSLSSEEHANLAPYSQFSNLSFGPPYVMFAANQTGAGERKDSVRNAEATRVFC
jgi:flavin reductase (DIM6/NTAB) family NADH-FMN oxidoreductase RutF